MCSLMFAVNCSSGMCVARFREAPASIHQALIMIAHGGLALAIVAIITIKGIVVRAEQKKLCEWLG